MQMEISGLRRKLPTFVSVGTTTVNDVSVLVKSSNVGNIKKTRVINEGLV